MAAQDRKTARLRPLAARDRDAWGALWQGYLAFYETELPQSQFDLQFARLLGGAPRDVQAIVAEDGGGDLVGLAHYLFHCHGWHEADVCYLQDLYVAPAARGQGLGRALIEAVYEAADADGAADVYWTTQDFNAEARVLYDRIGKLTPFIKYQRG
ncbi:MAG: GNAT family N-acetyltransferase [Pseudomonadota bacterium]